MSPVAYNQIAVPAMMYGTAWKKQATSELVQKAVEAGFTAIDTANQLIHYDEALVGDALVLLQQKRGLKRESLFLQTKFTSVDGQDHRTPYDASAPRATQVVQSMDSSLKHLHTDFIDSYVLHGPYSRNGLIAADWEVWSAIEELYKAGKTRMIGISNVSAEQLSQLCAKSTVKPMMVQNRCYAAMGWDYDVRQICVEHNIIYQGFSLLTANGQALSNPAVRAIATRLRCEVTQLIFAFAMHVGMLPLTGTTNVEHMEQDLQAEKLVLTLEDIELIENVAVASRR